MDFLKKSNWCLTHELYGICHVTFVITLTSRFTDLCYTLCYADKTVYLNNKWNIAVWKLNAKHVPTLVATQVTNISGDGEVR